MSPFYKLLLERDFARRIQVLVLSEHPELARPPKRCLGALDTVSWPWIPFLGSLEPPRRDGENAQKTGKNGEKMGEIRPKTCEGGELTKDQRTGAELGRGECPDVCEELGDHRLDVPPPAALDDHAG